MRQRGRRIHLSPPGGCPPCRRTAPDRMLCGPDVLAAGTLRALSFVESHGLAFAELVEGHLLAGGLMKEILVAVRRGDEAESLVPDEPLDRTVASSHVVSLLDTRLPKPGVRGWSKRAAVKRRSLQLMRDRNSGMDPSGSRLGSHTVAPKGDCVMRP